MEHPSPTPRFSGVVHLQQIQAMGLGVNERRRSHPIRPATMGGQRCLTAIVIGSVNYATGRGAVQSDVTVKIPRPVYGSRLGWAGR